MNKKIITCAPLPPPNGGITNWYRILKNTAEGRGYSLINVDISPKTDSIEKSVFYRLFVQGFSMIGLRFKLKETVKNNPDVKVAHLTTSGSLALVRDIIFLSYLKRKNIKSVLHIHFGRIPEMFYNKTMESLFMKKALKIADCVIAIDGNTYKTLSSIVDSSKVFYIPNPVEDSQSYNPNPSKNILFLGNVIKTKGIEELLTAWSDVISSHPDWKLQIVGKYTAEYKAFLDSAFNQEGVEFLGFADHSKAMKILEDASALVLPSYTEGFPNVVIEAMIRHKPVIASDVGAIPEILSGDCGILIKPKDVSSLSSALEALISDEKLCQDLGANGYNKAFKNYSADIVFNKYAEIWNQA